MLGRIVGGLLCGNLGVVKSFLTEITDDTNRSGAFYLFSLSWAVGSVFAPLVGGMLCSPAEKFPTVFPDHPKSLFVEYPYLFPCLITVSINVIAALLCMLFMVETVGSKKDDPERGGALFSDDNTVGTDESHHSLLEEGIELPPLHRKLSASGGYDRVPISTLDYEVTQVNPLQIAVETKYDTILEFEESTFDNPGKILQLLEIHFWKL